MFRLAYLLLKLIFRLQIRVFYRRRTVLGKDHFRFAGPAIVVVNHPSTLMDVLNAGVEIRQEMFFLANYGLFRHPVANWLLRRMYCIPVMRAEDQRPGEERDNSAAFEASFQRLERGDVLFIAAEGVSWMNRFVRPLKTGAARIALTAESRNDWALDVKIIPVGLSYSAPDQFRSEVVVQAGPPVFAREWAAAFKTDPEGAIAAMTARLEQQLRALTIHTRDEAGEVFIGRLEAIAARDNPLPPAARFRRSQLFTARFLDDAALRGAVDAYFDFLKENKTSDRGIALRSVRRPYRAALAESALLTLGAPVFLPALAIWFLPCFIPWLINKSLKLYVGYSAVVKIFFGMITFPLAIWAVWAAALRVSGSTLQALVAVVGMILLGFFCESYLRLVQNVQARRSAFLLPADKAEKLMDMREQIAHRLRAASVD
jgi:1-acyl-sn-glycerol-3-phosphate acyltransferase